MGEYPGYFAYLPTRILNNCILLPIEAESQDTALRIFSTLNDRGKPLSDTDIFKAQFYKYYSDQGKKDLFVERWKELEMQCEKHLARGQGSPMDDLFTKYMYYVRAKFGIRNTTTEALRKFYEKDSYALLKDEGTLNDLEILAQFWEDIDSQNEEVFSKRILRKLYVLNNAPNSMWEYFASVYYMANKDREGLLEEEPFYRFLDRSTAFIFAYAFMHPGVNALRTPIYPEMIKLVNGEEVTFREFKFDREAVLKGLENYYFGNQRPITRSLLTWWAFTNEEQDIYNLTDALEIEHIYARKRHEVEPLSNPILLESLGNKALLEKRINIRAADYRFVDKKRFYLGYTTDRGKTKEASKDVELIELAKNKDDYKEQDIKDREKKIFYQFVTYLEEQGLLQ